MAVGTGATDELLEKLKKADRLVHEAILRSDEKPFSGLFAWLRRPARLTNELLVDKALGSVHDRLSEVPRLLRESHSSDAEVTGLAGLTSLTACVSRLVELLEKSNTRNKRDGGSSSAEPEEIAIWLVDRHLQCALVELGHAQHLRFCLDEELRRDPSLDEPRRQLSREQIIEFGRLRDELDECDVNQETVTNARARAIELLVERYDKRAHDDRHRETREALRRQLLISTAVALIMVVLAFGVFVTVAVGVRWWDVALVSFSGMLGSLLSGLRRVRDELRHLGDMTAFRSAFAAQLAAGAGLGILALVLFEAGILPVFTPQGSASAERSQPILAIYSFAAGFSEPFVIGAIRRIVGAPA